jgi:pimeloyl-ACP methyl ester carboxylesterase
VTGLTDRARAWERRGRYVDIDGHRIYTQVLDGTGPTIVFLHGYPSSSYDWRLVLPGLAGRRILLFDFLGFGLSAKPTDVRYSLLRQADLVESLVASQADGPVLIVGHDMGTSVATELMARELAGRLSFTIAGILLFNGSMVLEKAHLTPAQKALRTRFGPLLARLSNERVFRAQFSRIFSPDRPLTRDEAEDQWSLLAHLGGHRIIDRLTYYLHERIEFAGRWHSALREWPGRFELAWAGRDPVCVEAVLQAVRELRPSAPITRWPTLGHYPQLEDPAAVASVIADFAAR